MDIYETLMESHMSKRELVELIKQRDTDLLEMKQMRSEDFQFLYYVCRCIENGKTQGLEKEIKDYISDSKSFL